MREIGSEFWMQYEPVSVDGGENEICLLSGRTALRFIIDDICSARSVRKVLMPSYCCESMIEPFVKAGIEVQFYQVDRDNIDYPYDNDADVVFLIDFFGYAIEQNIKIARCEKQVGKVVIYDATHKLDGNPKIESYADYSFCSYRKWFYCNYAKCVKYSGVFDNKNLMHNERYTKLRDEAAALKEKYMSGSTVNKDSFLSGFNAAEQMLDEDYTGYIGRPVDFDLSEIVSQRRKNALYLIKELKKIPQVELWRDSIKANDTPMFVPILVDPSIRYDLRRKLIDAKIYCPIHWPKTAYHGSCNKLYDMELSLVCDQRYDISDMERIINVIKDFFNE